jgi:uncharacterized protein (TIGR02118 family)
VNKVEINSVIGLTGYQIKPESEDQYNKWLNEVHIPILFKFPGLKAVTRFKITKKDDRYPNYLTIMEFEDEEAFKAFKESPEVAEARKDTLARKWTDKDRESKWRVEYKAINAWRK